MKGKFKFIEYQDCNEYAASTPDGKALLALRAGTVISAEEFANRWDDLKDMIHSTSDCEGPAINDVHRPSKGRTTEVTLKIVTDSETARRLGNTLDECHRGGESVGVGLHFTDEDMTHTALRVITWEMDPSPYDK